MPSRLPGGSAEARARMAACHIACLPRCRSAVTELVPPIKLVEAMALACLPWCLTCRCSVPKRRKGRLPCSSPPAMLRTWPALWPRRHRPDHARSLGQAARQHAHGTRDWNAIAKAVIQTLPKPAMETVPDTGADIPLADDRAQTGATAAALTRQARALCATDLPGAIALAEQAQALDPQPWALSGYCACTKLGNGSRRSDARRATRRFAAQSLEAQRIARIINPPARAEPDPVALAAAEQARQRTQAGLARQSLCSRRARWLPPTCPARLPWASRRSARPAALARQVAGAAPARGRGNGARDGPAGRAAGRPAAEPIGSQPHPADSPSTCPAPEPDPAALAAAEDARRRAEAQARARIDRCARGVQDSDPLQAARLGEEAHALDPQPWRAKWLAFRLHDAGHLARPAALLQGLPRIWR
jgi:hypothetical protein